jgi:hypothetical protein
MSGLGTHASGFIGIAFESTYGTWVTPTRFFPIKSESMSESHDNQKRRLIRGLADNLGHVLGPSTVAGDITCELLEDVLPYFLYCSRNTVAKTGAGPYVYTTTPAHWGSADQLPTGKKGLSITVVKNGEVFGFSGCVLSALEVNVDNNIPYMKLSVVGKQEASQILPTYTAVSTDIPYNASQYSIEIPTTTQVFDITNFTFTVNDNAETQFRLANTLTPQWVKLGAREVTLNVERDFSARTEWDSFKALTAQSVSVKCTKSASASVAIKLPNAIRDTHDIDGLSDQGAATMQQITWMGDYDTTTSKSYEVIVTCNTNIP